MTPDEARDLLDGTTPGPWEWCEGKDQNGEFVALRGSDGADALRTWDGDLYASGIHGTNADKALAASAPTLAALFAGMRAEYRVDRMISGHWTALPLGLNTPWTDDKDRADGLAALSRAAGRTTRIVRRYVTTEEKIE